MLFIYSNKMVKLFLFVLFTEKFGFFVCVKYLNRAVVRVSDFREGCVQAEIAEVLIRAAGPSDCQ